MSGDSSDLDDMLELEVREDSRCAKCLKHAIKGCFLMLFRLATEPVFWLKRKWDKLTTRSKEPSEIEVFTEIECSRCNSTITVGGLIDPTCESRSSVDNGGC